MLSFFLKLRPLLLLALTGSALFFSPAQNQDAANATQERATTQQTDTNAASPSDNTNEEVLGVGTAAPAAISLLASVFGTALVDPLFTLPEYITGNTQGNAGQTPVATDTSATREPDNEPQRSIYLYLIASSNVGFVSDPSRTGLALATAEQGDLTSLDRLIGDLEAQQRAFLELRPPQELRETHEASARITGRYIQLLRDARANAPGKVLATWNSAERASIASDANATVADIRAVVERHGIALPAGVLP